MRSRSWHFTMRTEPQVLRDKAVRSEGQIAPLRVAMVGSGIATYPFFFEECGGSSPWAWGLLFFSAIYALAVYFLPPYRRDPGLNWARVTSGVDSLLTLLWTLATGGGDSPYTAAVYAVAVGLGLRHGVRGTSVAALFLAAAYFALCAVSGELLFHFAFVLIRSVYLVMVGLAGAIFSDQLLHQTERLARSNRLLQTEIAERHRAEGRLEQTANELKRSNASLEKFAFIISHDLQEPLRTIWGYCSLMKLKYAPALGTEGKGLLEATLESAKRMQRMVEALLSYARVQQSQWQTEPVALTQPVSEAIAGLRSKIEKVGATVVVGELPIVLGNHTLLVHVFQNLIGNGIKFNQSPQPHVEIRARPQGEDWLIAIADNGIGIDPDFQPQVFQPFRRFYRDDQFEGNGMGLAICREGIERLKGRIWFETSLGRGTTFFFTLPGVKASQEPARPDERRPNRLASFGP